MDRREFGVKLPIAVAVHVALPSPTDPLRAEIDEVIGAYTTSSPQRLLPQARQVLDKITRTLGKPLMDGVRRRLLVDASEVATVAGRMALFGGHPGEADAYFTQARKFADQSQLDRARGCALWQASMLHHPLLGDGDSEAALGMLQAAAPLVGEDGLAAKAMAIDWADHCAALERDYKAMRLLERADRIRLTDDGQGYYSLRGGFAGYDETQFAASRGATLARLGRADEALDALHRSLAAPNVNIRTFAVDLSDIALAHTKGGDPEPACEAAIRCLNASKAVGYTVGADCVLGVRDMMPPEWTPLACVRELDERLGRPT